MWYDARMRKRIRRTARARSLSSKRRITLSLSTRSVQFLDRLRSETKAPSTSAMVERIIDDLQGRADLDNLNAQMKAHYDSRPESASREEREWGMTGESGMESALRQHDRSAAVNE